VYTLYISALQPKKCERCRIADINGMSKLKAASLLLLAPLVLSGCSSINTVSLTDKLEAPITVNLTTSWVEDQEISNELGFTAYKNESNGCIFVNTSVQKAYEHADSESKTDEELTELAVPDTTETVRNNLQTNSASIEFFYNYNQGFPFKYIEGESKGLQIFRHYLSEDNYIGHYSFDVRCPLTIDYGSFYNGIGFNY
jgi:hypothetical protein